MLHTIFTWLGYGAMWFLASIIAYAIRKRADDHTGPA
jgi:hypothetical protein